MYARCHAIALACTVVLVTSALNGATKVDDGQRGGGASPTAEFPDILGDPPSVYLNINHINDVYDVRQSPRCITKMESMRDANTLTMFSGDFMGPSIVSDIMKGGQMVAALAVMNATWSVVGNHEYDYGVDRFLEVETMLQRGWTYTDPETGQTTTYRTENLWLVANFFQRDQRKLMPSTKRWAEKTVNGLKVCAFGLVDTAWMEATKLTLDDFLYEDFLHTARYLSFKLRNKVKCDLIFVLSHMENKSDEALLTDKGDPKERVPAVDVDFVFGGHDHLYYLRRLGENVLLKSGMDFEQFSNVKVWWGDKLDFTLSPGTDKPDFSYLYDEEKNGDQTEFLFSLKRENPRHEGQYLNVLVTRVNVVSDDPKHLPLEAYIKQEVDPKIAVHLQPLLHITGKLDARENVLFGGESAVMNLFADVGRAYYGGELAMVYVRMLKGEKVYHPDSYLRRLDFMRLFPYRSDRYAEVEMTGREVVESLKAAVPLIRQGNKRWVGVSGVTFTISWTIVQASKGKKAQLNEASVQINGQPVEPDRVYRAVIITGMTDPKWGMGPVGGKKPKTPLAQQIEPIELFDYIGNLLAENSGALKKEFTEFKTTHCPGVDLNAIATVLPATDDAALQTLDQATPSGSCSDLLPQFSAAVLRRLRLYSLATKYMEPDGRPVLSVRPTAGGRISIEDSRRAKEKIVL